MCDFNLYVVVMYFFIFKSKIVYLMIDNYYVYGIVMLDF